MGFVTSRAALPCALAVAAVGVSAFVASASVVPLINDTQMPLANWSASSINTTGGFDFGVGNPGAGGNGGAYRSISHTSATSPASGAVVHLHAVTWTPATDGAITTLDMMLDVNCFDGGTSNAVGFGLVMVQGGVIFFGPTFTPLTNSGWRTDLRRVSLVATDFDDRQMSHASPDFSATGGTIRFGFYSSNGTASGAAINSSSGADNFVVTLDAVPAPSVASALLMGGMAAARRRRR